MKNILRLSCVSCVLIFNGCSDEIKSPSEVQSLKQSESQRMQVTSDYTCAGWRCVILQDNKTGREFLSYRDGLVEIKPKGE